MPDIGRGGGKACKFQKGEKARKVVAAVALTHKQKRFADEYIVSLNATQAAIKAGYSKRTAGTIGSENMQKPEIRAYIDERLEALQSEKIADQEEVLAFLTAVMREEVTEEVLKGTGPGAQTIAKVKVGARDRIRASELIGKRYGLFTDKVDVTTEAQVVIVDDVDTDADDLDDVDGEGDG